MAEAADADHPLPVGTQLIGEAAAVENGRHRAFQTVDLVAADAGVAMAAAARLAEKNVLLTPSGRASALAFMMTLRADRSYKDAQRLMTASLGNLTQLPIDLSI